MAAKIPQGVRERQLRELADADGYTFVGWVDGYQRNTSKAIVHCKKHGDWHTTVNTFVDRGSRCRKCSNDINGKRLRTPLSECEQQIRKVIEPDGYTLTGIIGEYKGVDTKILISCKLHGESRTTVHGVIYGGRRCKLCGIHNGASTRRMPQHEQEFKLSKLATIDGYHFVGWVDGYKNNKSRLVMNCQEHGNWQTDSTSFINSGYRCSACAGIRKIPQGVREEQIRELADDDGYSFVGWVGEYINSNSRVRINCVTHGDWTPTINDFVNSGIRCIGCSGTSKIPEHVREEQIRVLADDDGHSFIGWIGSYKNAHTGIIINCPHHGEYRLTVSRYVNSMTRCPNCSIGGGYSKIIPGTLYGLLSECRTMIKIGISNVPDRRHVDLRRATPFGFTVHRQLHCEDGTYPPMLEREFHNAFPSAGLKGFDGATEWRMWYPEVNTWFDLLGG